jgi:hypothetical protein
MMIVTKLDGVARMASDSVSTVADCAVPHGPAARAVK